MAVRSANVNVRVEPDIKEQAEEILGQLGVSVHDLSASHSEAWNPIFRDHACEHPYTGYDDGRGVRRHDGDWIKAGEIWRLSPAG